MGATINPYFARQLRSALSREELELILFPTEKCNFRCVYCYEDFKFGRMSDRVIAAVKSLIDSRMIGLKVLKINWFGGEPMMARDIVLDISRHTSEACGKAGVKFLGGMTTNAYLLDPDVLCELVDLGVTTYQVSLDGDADEHDKTRILANGQATFHRIWENLLGYAATSSPFSITLRLHVTKQNALGMEAFLKKAVKVFKDDNRFHYYIKCIEKLGGSGSAGVAPDKQAIADTLSRLNAIADATENSLKTFSEGYVCYAARPNSYTIRSDGSVGKCTTALKADSNRVGSLAEDGTMELDVEKMQKWFAGYESLDPKILKCPVYSVGWT